MWKTVERREGKWKNEVGACIRRNRIMIEEFEKFNYVEIVCVTALMEMH